MKPTIELTTVTKVYRGRPGHCRCGCLGTYWYPRTQAEEAKRTGSKINDTQVKEIVRLLNAHLDEVFFKQFPAANVWDFEHEGRLYAVYAPSTLTN